MKPELPNPITVDDYTLYPTGHGSGMFGVPGDYTPPSRFVRLAMLTYYADKQVDALSNLSLSQHIINTFDIPFGIIVDKSPEGKITTNESTQWVTIRDITNKIMYFRTYDNMDLRKIDFSKIDFNAKTVRRIPMYGSKQNIIDITK
jgi:choloylglycine hydrolase